MAAKRRTWRWVSRSERSEMLAVWKTTRKPVLGASIYQEGNVYLSGHNSVLRRLCRDEFEKVFGITLKPMTCVRVEFTARVLPEIKAGAK